MSYRITLARPGAAPYLSVTALTTGAYPADAIAPLGGTVEVTRGGFCGSGSLSFSRPLVAPDGTRCQPGDWVRVYLPGDAEDDPTYLGAVTGEPWREGGGTLSLEGLRDHVGAAAWRGANSGPFRSYVLTAISRCVLPPGVTVGDIPEDDSTLKADTPFELLGDAMQAAMPAVDGGTWGVDARARIGVYRPTPEVTHRFALGQAQTPPGQTSGYRNCVRFPYTRPDGVQAWFEGRATLEVAAFGERWEVAQLPAAVTVTQVNPYASLSAGVELTLQHPDLPEWQVRQFVDAPVFSPEWGGKLSSAANLEVLYGGGLPLAQWSDSTVTVVPSGVQDLQITRPEPGLVVEKVVRGVASPVYINPNTTEPWVEVKQDGLGEVTLRYTAESVNAYRNSQGKMPTGFRVAGVTVQPISASVTAASSVNPVSRRLVPGRFFEEATDNQGGKRFVVVPRSFDLLATARIVLPLAKIWQAGDVVTTDAAVTAVQAELNTNPPTVLNLTRTDDDAETGRRVWLVPQNYQVSAFILTGPPAQIGWVGVRLSDTAALARYAYGLLRYRTQPVRVWTGRYSTLKRVAAHGVALFEQLGDLPDEALDVQRVTYDLSAWTVTVEAGTPTARDSDEAVAAAIESVRRETRVAGGGTAW